MPAATSRLRRHQPAEHSTPLPSAWLPPPCSVCGHDTEVGPLPADEGFFPDERICLRCDQALLVGSLGPLLAEPAGQPRSA